MFKLTEKQVNSIKKAFIEENWEEIDYNLTKNGTKINTKNDLLLFKKSKNLEKVLELSPKPKNKNGLIQPFDDRGQSTLMLEHKRCLTPTPTNFIEPADFSKFNSLKNIRKNDPNFVIAFDSEWENLPDGLREVLTWQFSVIWEEKIHTFIFVRVSDYILNISDAIAYILDYFDFHYKAFDERDIVRYSYCTEWDKASHKPITKTTTDREEAYIKNKYKYVGFGKASDTAGWSTEEIPTDREGNKIPRANINEKTKQREWSYFRRYLDFESVDHIPITLLCHAGIVDISTLGKSKYILSRSSEVQGGLVSLQPTRIAIKSIKSYKHAKYYAVTLSIADTMCHAPAGAKKLADLGNAINVPKVDIPQARKEHMLKLLTEDPKLYIKYAATDSEVTLLYAAALYGYNNAIPVTMTSVTAVLMRDYMDSYLKADKNGGFDKVYRGLEIVKHGLYELENRPGYVESKSKEPINSDTNITQNFCSMAYHGGYNSSSEIGYFNKTTYDHDLKNAYPTAMTLVPDIDWNNPIKFELRNVQLSLSHFQVAGSLLNPILPFVCYCSFEFPEDVKYCCIPVNVDGVPVYPRSSKGMQGVYVAGPYIYLALQLGAKVFCERGFVLNTLFRDDLTESHSISVAVEQFVKDRGRAKDFYGKGSLQEQILKLMVNSGYGKVAQNVVQKQTWSAFKDLMEDIGCSCITNPFSAMMITSIVQCELLAAQNELHNLGYGTYSVTTDGFISDVPADVLNDLNLYGLAIFMKKARLFLTDNQDPTLWEEKHCQNDLINFTTRGNVSLEPGGVCARNSYKTGFLKDSLEDRYCLYTEVLSRTGALSYIDEVWPSLKDLVKDKPYKISKMRRNIRMDFDMKRKPDRKTFKTDYIELGNEVFNMEHFETLPFNDIEEFKLYRAKKDLCKCLRTAEDWRLFFAKIDTAGTSITIKDLDWNILMSVIMGYRAGRWEIPMLEGLTVAEKCDIINERNDSKKKFKVNDWKNARRPERQSSMLPIEYLKDKLRDFNVFI